MPPECGATKLAACTMRLTPPLRSGAQRRDAHGSLASFARSRGHCPVRIGPVCKLDVPLRLTGGKESPLGTVTSMNLLAVWAGKLTLLALRMIGRRGNALPGLVVEKLFPGFLARAMARLPEGVVLVTGTNGKTTTTKMVAIVLGERLRVLTNDTGSNFVRGAITATVEHASWSGRLPYDVAVFELDEAWAVRFVEKVPPRRALLLNVMRDQLDRFGEIDTTARLLGKVAAATTGNVVLNRDDERVAALAADTDAEVSYYGVSAELRELFPNDEELYGGPVHVSQLPAAVELRALPGPARPNTTMRIDETEAEIVLRAEGPHNAQNACGAAATALSFGFDAATV